MPRGIPKTPRPGRGRGRGVVEPDTPAGGVPMRTSPELNYRAEASDAERALAAVLEAATTDGVDVVPDTFMAPSASEVIDAANAEEQDAAAVFPTESLPSSQNRGLNELFPHIVGTVGQVPRVRGAHSRSVSGASGAAANGAANGEEVEGDLAGDADDVPELVDDEGWCARTRTQLRPLITRFGRVSQDPTTMTFPRMRQKIGGVNGRLVGDPYYPASGWFISIETRDKTDITSMYYYAGMEYGALISDDFVIGLERATIENANSSGCLHAHLAVRGVHCPMGTAGAAAIRADMRKYLIGNQTHTSLKVHVKAIDQSSSSHETFERKTGYLQKCRDDPNFSGARSSHLSQEYLDACADEYDAIAVYKREGLTFLTHKTMFNFVHLFELKHVECLELPLVYIVYYMVKYESFALGFDFIMPSSGRPLCPQQVEAYRKLSTKPDRATPVLIAHILYGGHVHANVVRVPDVLRVSQNPNRNARCCGCRKTDSFCVSQRIKWRDWDLVKTVNLAACAGRILEPETDTQVNDSERPPCYDDPMSCGRPYGWHAEQLLELIYKTGMAAPPPPPRTPSQADEDVPEGAPAYDGREASPASARRYLDQQFGVSEERDGFGEGGPGHVY